MSDWNNMSGWREDAEHTEENRTSPKSVKKRRKSKEDVPSHPESESTQKRVFPYPLRKLPDWDVELTNAFVNEINRRISKQVRKSETKAFEISGSGYLWFPMMCLTLWFFNNQYCKQVAVNILLVLLMDVAIVAVLKAVARRRRPPSRKADFFGAVGPDKFSFPSGHASRSVLLAIILTQFEIFHVEWYLMAVFTLAVWSWAVMVSLSRIVNGRHFVLDVLAGVIVGYLESRLARSFWMSSVKAEHFLTWFFDDSYDE